MRALATKAIAATTISILPAIENPPNHLATPEPNLENIPPILENTPLIVFTNGAKIPSTLPIVGASLVNIFSNTGPKVLLSLEIDLLNISGILVKTLPKR